MKSKVWIRCFIVSAVIAAIAPAFSMTLAVPNSEGQAVDLEAIEMEYSSEGDESALTENVRTLPTRTIDGFFDRIAYVFSHPQVAIFYFRASLTWFFGLFIATMLVGYLGARDITMAQHSAQADAW